ncbi:MAG: hypothetical protein K2M63_11335 [Muribaculaceae bacterium]|nr:hypothetical protein [Muribaculaceae bacterium]
MKLFFEKKNPGRHRQKIEPILIEIEKKPSTVAELIEETVRVCVAEFNDKAVKAPERDDLDADNVHNVLSGNTIENLAETGRIVFGMVYNDKTEDSDAAVANALQCYEDGLFRLFLNGVPLKDINDSLDLADGDHIIVVRLTLLSGRLW